MVFLMSEPVLYSHTYSKSMDQPGMVVNPARGQLNRKSIFPCPCSRIFWSGVTGLAVSSRVSLLISILRLNMVLTTYNGVAKKMKTYFEMGTNGHHLLGF